MRSMFWGSRSGAGSWSCSPGASGPPARSPRSSSGSSASPSAAGQRLRDRPGRGHAPPVRGRLRTAAGSRPVAGAIPRVLEPAAGRAGHRARQRQAPARRDERSRLPDPERADHHGEEGGTAPMTDILNELDAVQRETGHRRLDTGEDRTVVLRRRYDAPIEDVWDAVTNPDRINRWFLPISGDLRLSPAGDGVTEFELEHAGLGGDHWAEFGPGAVGSAGT